MRVPLDDVPLMLSAASAGFFCGAAQMEIMRYCSAVMGVEGETVVLVVCLVLRVCFQIELSEAWVCGCVWLLSKRRILMVSLRRRLFSRLRN